MDFTKTIETLVESILELANKQQESINKQQEALLELANRQQESLIRVVELFVTNKQDITPELLESLKPAPVIKQPKPPKQTEQVEQPEYRLTNKETLLGIYKLNKSGELEFASEVHITKQIKSLANQFGIIPDNEIKVKGQNEVFKSVATTLYGLAHQSIHDEMFIPLLHVNEADIMIAHECLNFVTQTPLVDWFFELIQEYVSKNLTLDGEYDVATEAGYQRIKEVSQNFLSDVEDEILEALPDIPEHILNTMIWRVEKTNAGFEMQVTSPLESTELMFRQFGPFDKYNNQYDLTYEEFLKTLNTDESNRKPMNLSILSAAVPMFHLSMRTPRKKRYIASEGNMTYFNNKTIDTQCFIAGRSVSGRINSIPSYPHIDTTLFYTAKLANPGLLLAMRDKCNDYPKWFEDVASYKTIESIVWKHIRALPRFDELQKLAERYMTMLKRYNEAFQ